MTNKTNEISRRVFGKSAMASAVALAVVANRPESLMAKENETKVKQFPFYRATGTHRQLGQQHGEQAKEHIRAHIDFMCESMKLTR